MGTERRVSHPQQPGLPKTPKRTKFHGFWSCSNVLAAETAALRGSGADAPPHPAAEYLDCYSPCNRIYFHTKWTTKFPISTSCELRPLRKELDAVIARTIDNCSFCLGPDVAQFEKDFRQIIGAETLHRVQQRHLGVARGHAAARRRPGDEVAHHATSRSSPRAGRFPTSAAKPVFGGR